MGMNELFRAKLLLAIVAGGIGLYYVHVLITAMRYFRLRSKRDRKYNELVKLNAQVNQLSQNDAHWSQLFREISPLNGIERRLWLERLRAPHEG